VIKLLEKSPEVFLSVNFYIVLFYIFSFTVLALLSRHNTSQSDIKVQHALLSTLKNLVIPQQNKPIVLEEGLIDVIYPMIELDQYLVIFKLLGTFRMVIDGQGTL
jgi:hypothetical protein